jgi:hypothetical protein
MLVLQANFIYFMNNVILSQILSIFAYTFLQVFFLRNVVLFDVAFSFAYIAVLLILARDINVLTGMLIGFGYGLLVDFFYNTMGVHAGACVFLMYLRPKVLSWTEPSGGYETWMQPQANIMGFQWFITYTTILTLFHHLFLFFIEAATFQLFWFTMLKIIASSLYTIVLITLFQYIFYPKKVGLR